MIFNASLTGSGHAERFSDLVFEIGDPSGRSPISI
jgi:hypothetical protein